MINHSEKSAVNTKNIELPQLVIGGSCKKKKIVSIIYRSACQKSADFSTSIYLLISTVL